jgi:signal peptidase II
VTDTDPSSSSGPATAPGFAPHPLAVQVGVLVTLAFVVLDQATKELVESLLEPGEFVPWLGAQVGWQLVYNPGGAFGLPAPAWLFLGVTVVVLVLVVRALPRATSLTGAVAFGMLLAGALGNALDRLFRSGDPDGTFGGGYVVDFVAWGTFPRFNVADSAITVGFVLLVVALLLEERREAAVTEGSASRGRDGDGDDGPSA